MDLIYWIEDSIISILEYIMLFDDAFAEHSLTADEILQKLESLIEASNSYFIVSGIVLGLIAVMLVCVLVNQSKIKKQLADLNKKLTADEPEKDKPEA